MVVSGAPVKENDHADRVCDMALDMVEAITDLKDRSTGRSAGKCSKRKCGCMYFIVEQLTSYARFYVYKVSSFRLPLYYSRNKTTISCSYLAHSVQGIQKVMVNAFRDESTPQKILATNLFITLRINVNFFTST